MRFAVRAFTNPRLALRPQRRALPIIANEICEAIITHLMLKVNPASVKPIRPAHENPNLTRAALQGAIFQVDKTICFLYNILRRPHIPIHAVVAELAYAHV